MAGEDQERFEDYLQLEYYIEEIQAGHIAHPPSELTPTQARVYRMAALFRSAAPAESQLRPEFASDLHARLEQEVQQAQPRHLPSLSRELSDTPGKERSHVSRRALLTGGAAAAASLVVGAGLEATDKSQIQPQAASPGAITKQWSTPLVPDGEGSWIPVAKLTDLGDEPHRFVTDSIVGYLIHSDGEQDEKPGVIAVSAACTHMGCLVHWQPAERKYHCPCHGSLFSEYGKPVQASPIRYLAALPRLETRITTHGTTEFIEIKVPTGTKMT